MKKLKNIISKAEEAVTCAQALPNITIYGTYMVEIDNFRSLLDLSPSSVRLSTTDGILVIDGVNLGIGFMTDESISVKGKIKNLTFE